MRMTQKTGSPEPQQPKKRKRRLGPRIRYALFIAVWIGLIAVAFNTYFALKFHKQFVNRDQGWLLQPTIDELLP